ncbi:MAG: glycoside hydrolase family protein [Chloroflexi bacterium OLB13]|nr:MAG: glycoside hydrolase family protein [Chloroflexi bacterium OLB13]
MVVVPVEITQDLTHEAAQLASIVSPAGLTPNAAGQLIGSLAPGFVTNAAYRVMPVVRNFNDPRAIDVQTVVDLIRDPALRQAHILNLVSVAISSGFDGLFVEYRGLPLDIRDEFSDFVSELKQAFSSNGLLLGVIVPAPENTGGEWDTGVFDWRVIGQVTDYLQVDLGLDPLAFAPGPDQRIEALFRWATREVSRYKLLAGLNALSLRETRGGFVPVSYADACPSWVMCRSPAASPRPAKSSARASTGSMRCLASRRPCKRPTSYIAIQMAAPSRKSG